MEDRQRPQSVRSGSYVVQTGDTLYSIAFRYGMDYRKMAAANAIPAPYTIYPGQLLYLREAEVANTSPRSASSSRKATVPPAPSKPAPRPAPKAEKVSKTAPAPATRTKATKPAPAPSGPVKSWRWPSSGKVVRGYSSSVHKGIDIAGKRGDAIYAVAAGTVVYAGTGIVGLGELLIIKHNDTYLSAYGHNDRLLVAEGQRVSAGQQIARKGSSGTDAVKLHFEIRKEGKPIDPMRLLPRR